MLVEVCCNSLESALNAQSAGADRIELCSELGVGGITPSYGIIKLVKERLSIPVHVLIRPRSGHFTYSDTEFEVMKADIGFCRKIGINGIVSGVLQKDASVDLERTRLLIEMTKPLHFTFHRAFDWVPNPVKTLRQLEDIGVDTILTSGKHLTAENGLENLKKWQQQTQVTLMAGAGILPENILKFKKAGLKAVHLSGTSFVNEVSISRKIPMNAQKHLQEHHVAVTNAETIRQIVQAVK
ncbi:copper homeostasis protein CutC [Allomuricauda sp. d1]|uniref:copper homeostasis protein CutC n=1 Tax=Allomuricauda sp. d1 TaxID=3136725 RepID=UPI0031DC26F2